MAILLHAFCMSAWVLWSMIMKSKNFQTCSKDVVGKHEARNLSLMYSPRLAQIRWF